MVSSKKTKEEAEKKSKETKTKKLEKKKETNRKTKAKTSSKKHNTNNKISNGTVSDSGDVVTPTSSTESQEEQSQEKKSPEHTKDQRSKSKNPRPKKSSKKQELDDEEEKEDTKSSIFPMSRIKRIMKSQGFDSLLTGEAVFLVNKATEKFLEQFCEDAYACCAKDRKKSVAYKHLASVVSQQRRYDFLSDFVPEKIKAENALAERKLTETGEG